MHNSTMKIVLLQLFNITMTPEIILAQLCGLHSATRNMQWLLKEPVGVTSCSRRAGQQVIRWQRAEIAMLAIDNHTLKNEAGY